MLRHMFSVLALTALLSSVSAAQLEKSIDIFAWPVTESKSQPFATVSYTYPSLNTTLKTYTPYQKPADIKSLDSPDQLVRLGFSSPQTDDQNAWTGIAVSPFSLGEEKSKTLKIYVDEDGVPTQLGFSSSPVSHVAPSLPPKAKKGMKKAQQKSKKNTPSTGDKSEAGGLVVEVLRPTPGPQAVLNKPVVLNAEGQLDGKEPEKSFFQK